MAKEKTTQKSAAERAKEYVAMARKILKDEKVKDDRIVLDFLKTTKQYDEILAKAKKVKPTS